MIEFIRSVFGDTAAELLSRGFNFLLFFAPVWVPLLLLGIFWQLWVSYVRAKNISKKEWVFLEVRLPKEQQRSPLGMEVLLTHFYNKGDIGSFVKRYWKGEVTPWASLELVSIGGDIHFIFYVESKQKDVLMSRIYAQFPGAEIFEVSDYTRAVEYDEDKYSLWGCEFVLAKEDPYPIKTYVDYGLDKDPKEEYKIDPMSPMLEWLGSLRPGEQAWIQFMIRYHLPAKSKRDKWIDFKLTPWEFKFEFKEGWFAKEDAWKAEAKTEIEKIKKEATIGGDDDEAGRIQLTPGQKDVIAALERSISKLAFDVGIRAIYIAEQDKFNKGNIGGLIGSFTQYNTNNLNGFRPNNTPGYDDYPWLDPKKKREAKNKRGIFAAYRRRGFFYPPYFSKGSIKPTARKSMVLNTEELATVYHFPGSAVTTPTIKRIPSRKAEAPPNLPV